MDQVITTDVVTHYILYTEYLICLYNNTQPDHKLQHHRLQFLADVMKHLWPCSMWCTAHQHVWDHITGKYTLFQCCPNTRHQAMSQFQMIYWFYSMYYKTNPILTVHLHVCDNISFHKESVGNPSPPLFLWHHWHLIQRRWGHQAPPQSTMLKTIGEMQLQNKQTSCLVEESSKPDWNAIWMGLAILSLSKQEPICFSSKCFWCFFLRSQRSVMPTSKLISGAVAASILEKQSPNFPSQNPPTWTISDYQPNSLNNSEYIEISQKNHMHSFILTVIF